MKKSGLFDINVPLPSSRAMLKDGDIAQPTAPIGIINANQSAINFAGAPRLCLIAIARQKREITAACTSFKVPMIS